METNLMTITAVAQRLGIAPHVAKYAIRLAGIEPVARFGTIRAFSPHQLPEIRAAVERSSRRQLTAEACHA